MRLFSNICKCAQLGERAHLCVVCQLSVRDSVVSLCLNPVVKELSGSKSQGLIILTKHTQAHSHNHQRTIRHLSVRHKTFCPKDKNNPEEYCGPVGCHWPAVCVCIWGKTQSRSKTMYLNFIVILYSSRFHVWFKNVVPVWSLLLFCWMLVWISIQIFFF